jgi:hypothetical protein
MRIALLALLVAGTASAASNPYLSAAVRLYDDIEYESALEQLKKAETWSGNGPAEDVTIQLYKGLVLAELGNSDAAASAFKAALALDPKADVPAKVSPKVRSLFVAARAELARTRPAEQPRTEIKDEPARPVIAPPPPKSHEAQPSQPQTATAPPSRPASDVPTAQPQGQREIQVRPDAAEPRVRSAVAPEVSQSASPPPPASGSSWVLPVVLFAGAAAVGGGGAYFGVQSSQAVQAARTEPYQSVANGHLNDAKTFSWVANGMYGGAALLAIIGAAVAIAESR